jgi:hypothetical protein
MNLEKCLVTKNIHMDFIQWLVFPFLLHCEFDANVCSFSTQLWHFHATMLYFLTYIVNSTLKMYDSHAILTYQRIPCYGNLIILLCFAVLAIILVGLLYGFFIAIICGQRINERHYHVLAKQELTKVCYVIINAFKSFWLTNYYPQKTKACCYAKLVICLLLNCSLVIIYAILGKQ